MAGDASASPELVKPAYRSRIEWTRLITASPFWDKHARNDAQLLEYIAAHTEFTVEERSKATSASDLQELCRNPFVFAHDVSELPKPEAHNLAEYMKRGGFVCIDYCANPTVNSRPSVYIDRQKKALLAQLPQLKITPLPPAHEIFTSYFKMKHYPPQKDGGWLKGAPTLPLLALQLDGRMVGVIAANGFHCAWDNPSDEQNAVDCMQMVTNIYIYAMTH